jgi:hypothetical protein
VKQLITGPDKVQVHFNSNFFSHQFLWTLTFAAQLVLLTILLGRDRARRYPWFTAGIVMSALQLMAGVLLSGRMAMLPLQEMMILLADIGAIVSLLVLVEVARRAFAGARRSLWIVNTVGLVIAAVGVLVVWGPWPAWKSLATGSLIGKLRLMQLAAQKGDTLMDLLTVGVGLMVVLFGRRFKAGWRSHTQMIAIGLTAVAVSWLAIQQTWQTILRTAHPQSQQQYEQILDLGNQLMIANKVVVLAALIWWIVWLWLDEPGTKVTPAAETAPEPAESPVEK